VGRRAKADPKWIVPLLCRVGRITKREIGAIRVFDTDTRFEISRTAAPAFAAAVAEAPPGEPRITPAGEGRMAPRTHHRPAPPRHLRKAG
jgi:ATP-dependent RNA helicase DeaD